MYFFAAMKPPRLARDLLKVPMIASTLSVPEVAFGSPPPRLRR